MIAADHKPVLMDFGLSHLQSSSSTYESATDGSNGTVDYMAIELLDAEEDVKLEHTIHSDVWAFGMVAQVSLYSDLTFRYRLFKYVRLRKSYLVGVHTLQSIDMPLYKGYARALYLNLPQNIVHGMFVSRHCGGCVQIAGRKSRNLDRICHLFSFGY